MYWDYVKEYSYACIRRSGDIFSYEKTLPPSLSQRLVNKGSMGMRRFVLLD
jgi:hypothetical protein